MDMNYELSEKEILDLVKNYDTTEFIKLSDYYKGEHHAILEKESNTANMPNNILINNFAAYITDVNVGYFMGKPVSYTAPKEMEVMMGQVQDIFDYNDEQAENSVLEKQASIKGKVFEILYLDQDDKLAFHYTYPENMIVLYDDNIIPNYKTAIRFKLSINEEDKEEYYVEVYTDKEVILYSGIDGELNEIERKIHPFGDVPVIEVQNNDECLGDFVKVLSLIDAYNKEQSNTADDFEYFANAYLMIRNLSGTSDEDIADMKQKRTILVDGDGEASWLTKEMQDAAIENYKNRLQEDIHRFSMTPNLTDEKFAGNLSGVALKFKLWGLEQLASQKERLFKKGLQRRLELVGNYFKFNNSIFDWRKITIDFTRNIPTNEEDVAKMITMLRGIVSDQTLLSRLPFIEDWQKEKERLEEEATGGLDLTADEREIFDEDIDEETEEE